MTVKLKYMFYNNINMDVDERIKKLEEEVKKLGESLKENINRIEEKFDFEITSIKNALGGMDLKKRSQWFDDVVREIIKRGVVSFEELRNKYAYLAQNKSRFIQYAKRFGIEFLRIKPRPAPQFFFYMPSEGWIKAFNDLAVLGKVDLEAMQRKGEITAEERSEITKFLKTYYIKFLSVDDFRASLKGSIRRRR